MAPQAKRRKIDSETEEINFDPAARHEFLTGFHKRKVQRIKLAQEHAEKRAREERREERRKIREQRAAEIEQALNESRKMLQQIRDDAESQESDNSDSEEEEWQGFVEPAPVDYEEEYIDEDKYTTVTVEEMGLSKDALHKKDTPSSDVEEITHKEKKEEVPQKPKATKKFGSKSGVTKKKKKQFRYESKEERKVTRRKERIGSRKKASSRRER
ncbi:protein required for cell viability Rrp17, putative [Talaromyces stipitatus ATCC 10500]|uniref:Protein required for cell viability Rrp17, putative n=1 Tax=Talaromyces stipitatus (strain ATCC 10500 / CBS 375.48 / QM 6759 / NRRL 1006) TaxID=441959 RepID=B8LZD6_TALSN|nr:protein required for cell viability Rrp17, putative [Talaromyces stipitatus ATCC 10500]EED21689.1 protein required for cell viability Rrp17, putative [Talaromyces stipitatus ATCC 10500]